jgi:Tfp pilus assembly protein PilX
MGSIRRALDPRAEDGIALVLALMVLVVFSITTVAAVTMANSTTSSAASGNAQQNAYALAEAGVNSAEAILNANNTNASSPTLLGCSVSGVNVNNSAAPCTDLSVATSFGTAYFHGMYSQGTGSTGTWTITSSGQVPYQNAAGTLNRLTTATATVTGGGQSNNISVWNYMYSTAAPGPGCQLDLNGNHQIVDVPLYITGNLCVSGVGASVTQNTAGGGQAVDIRVTGTLSITGSGGASVGSSSTPLTSGYVGGGCTTVSGGPYHQCTTADGYYVSQTDTPITAVPPTLDFASYYTNASIGPNSTCNAGLTPTPNLMTTLPHAFDNDATMNGTNTAFDLAPTTFDYNCVTSTGTLDWNHTTHQLTISGSIFFDGPLNVSDSAAYYHGRGTIYANGLVTINGSLRAGCPASPAAATGQCAFNTAGQWNPVQDMLIIASNKSNAMAFDLSGNHGEFQGDMICPSTSTANLAGVHTALEGGIICGSFTFGNHTTIYPLPTITNLPPGAPVPPNSPATIGSPTYSG